MDQIDELVIYSEQDPELAEAFKWINEQALKRNETTYEFVYYVLQKGETLKKAKEWNNSRSKTDGQL